MNLSIFFQAAAIGLTAAASPGLFQAFLINQTLLGGWRRGAPVAFSPFISDPPIVITILLLLNQLPGDFIRWVSLAGGLFALYLAWGGWQQWRAGRNQATDEPPATPAGELLSNPWQILWRGALMNLLSPGPYTFWTLVLGPVLLEAWRSSPLAGLSFLAGFYTAFVGGMLGLVIVFHQARRLGPAVTRGLALLSILILALFGVLLIGRTVG